MSVVLPIKQLPYFLCVRGHELNHMLGFLFVSKIKGDTFYTLHILLNYVDAYYTNELKKEGLIDEILNDNIMHYIVFLYHIYLHDFYT